MDIHKAWIFFRAYDFLEKKIYCSVENTVDFWITWEKLDSERKTGWFLRLVALFSIIGIVPFFKYGINS
jgi:hypothetical protein